MNREKAVKILTREFPVFNMEIQEYLSFAEIDKFDEEKLVADFMEYLDK